MTAHDLTRIPPAPLRRARLTFFLVAVVVPVVISAIGVAVIVAWLPSMPDQVAVHWGVSGADGFAPASTYLWILLGVGLVLPVLMAITTFAAVGAHWGGAARLMGALAAGLAAFATAMSLGSLAMQRDLAPEADVPGIGLVMLGSFAALAAVGAVAWAVQPRVGPESGPTLESRQIVRIAEGERVVWLATTSMPRAAVAVLLLLLLSLAALAAFMLGTGVQGGWVVAVVVLVVAFAMVATTAFRVRVTPEGFAARALIGWPRIEIPLDEVESARAVDVSPFGEFGGWGWRIALDGRTGIVIRRGPAIEVARRGRRPFLVTIDGAEEAAALLQAYVDRARLRGATRTDQGKATS
ncbi:DUF1648 domain-containing protein [Microbacterium sp. TPD7012]|uniref:DUF1648 domain-containing protein n=2 Tax=Bacillati TaxID=1783272 RepID=UPI000D517506|nr:DUF1648 domain-containing protein [Microbacterium sp. TPD7012]PVE91536.1 hypothetical protein DC434_19165 [Microbacterium sp. TPD7012]